MCSILAIILTLFIFINIYVNSFNFDTDFPIIYFDINENAKVNKSHFGFSVILYEGDNNTKPWIQIGAPRGHNTDYYGFFQPGLVYRCPISEKCSVFGVDMQVNTANNKPMGKNKFAYIPKKDKAWIGASMDIDSKNKRVVICGPRWINSKREHYIEGACYWSFIQDHGTRQLLPLTNTDHEVKDGVYYYPMGQTGMSVHLPKSNPAQIVIGAPGVYNWKGTVISYQDVNTSGRSTMLPYNKLTIPDSSLIKDTFSFGYLGYSVSSGYFFSANELLYVAGAPRSAAYRGQVLVFNYAEDNGDEIIIKQARQGETMGEYFGAAVAVANINGDHLDDLIIGAPHYSTKYDEGCIYILYGNRRGIFFEPDQSRKIVGNFSGGQFGSAIQSLGDIDNDGCTDIAVGAPYEDENHGVIYIYIGRKKGVPLQLSQRIEGKRLYSNLYGFGISFSRPTDIDGNLFNDIAVGSFLSDNAVILRMRPSVVLDMSVTPPRRLERKSTQFTVETCFRFSGRNLPPFLRISREIVLDKDHQRIYQHGKPLSVMEISEEIIVKHGIMTCNNISIGIKRVDDAKIDLEPIEIVVTQNLIENKLNSTPILVNLEVENQDQFCKTCPVVNRFKSKLEARVEIPYALNCGDDNKCEADLQVTAEFLGIQRDQFIIGLYKTLSLQITLQNKKEPAYLTSVEVTLPENVYLSAKPAECDEKTVNNQIIVVCFTDNPLEDKVKTITMVLDMEAITNKNKGKMPFVISAKTKSEEINPDDNTITKNLLLTTDANIKIIGKTERSIYYFDDDANATHVYEVHKSGFSPLNEFMLNVNIPVAYKKGEDEIQFMAIHKPRGFQDRQILTCHWPGEYIKDTEVLEVENVNQSMNRTKRAVPEDSANTTNTFDFAPMDKIVFINCSVPEVICKTVSCIVGPFKQSLKGASLQIKMVMDIKQIKKHILGDKQSIYLSTDGQVKEIEGQLKDEVDVSTAFVKEPEQRTAQTWIFIVAIVSGILILLLVILGLLKAGFFERKQKAELEALKQAEVKS